MQFSCSSRHGDGGLWPLASGGGDSPRAAKRARTGVVDASPEAALLPERCGYCRPCRLERDKPCAAPEVRAAAAAGHVGAALTLEGAAALGRCVSVFWPAERAFFVGRLVAFNPLEPAFLVLYADGEWHWEALRAATVQRLPAAARCPRPPPQPRAAQQRLQAAARRGDAGATLALLGQEAVGYVVDVAAGQRGGLLRAQVVSFEPRTRMHLLFYPHDAGEEWARLDRTTLRPAPLAEGAALPGAQQTQMQMQPLPPPLAAAAGALGLDDDEWADDALLGCLYAPDDAAAAGAAFLADAPLPQTPFV